MFRLYCVLKSTFPLAVDLSAQLSDRTLLHPKLHGDCSWFQCSTFGSYFVTPAALRRLQLTSVLNFRIILCYTRSSAATTVDVSAQLSDRTLLHPKLCDDYSWFQCSTFGSYFVTPEASRRLQLISVLNFRIVLCYTRSFARTAVDFSAQLSDRTLLHPKLRGDYSWLQCSTFGSYFVTTEALRWLQLTKPSRVISRDNWLNILWLVDPLLGKDSVNTFSRQRIRRQQSDNFRFYATAL
jgi:hypothetical protein